MVDIDRRKVKGTLLDRKERGDPMFRTNAYEYNTGLSNTETVTNSGIAAPLPQNTWNGQRIRGLRKRLNLSARKFGHLLGFPGKNCHITIYRHESDKIKPSIQTVMILEQLEKSIPQA
jgi:DNA-binding transcriptional regulator YiaG